MLPEVAVSIPGDSLAFYNGYIYKFLQTLVQEGQSSQDDLGEYYLTRVLHSHRGLLEYELMLVKQLLDHPPLPGRIWHAGVGIGAVAGYLAMHGQNVLAFEGEPGRLRLASRLREELAWAWPQVPAHYRLEGSYFPKGLAGLELQPGPEDLLLMSNVVSTMTEATMDDILATFPRFGGVLLEMRMFGRVRDTEAERAELASQITEHGLVDAGAVPAGPGTYFHLFLTPR